MTGCRLARQFAGCAFLLAMLPAAEAAPISFEHPSGVALGASAAFDPTFEALAGELTHADLTGIGAGGDEPGALRDRAGSQMRPAVRPPIYSGGTAYAGGADERGAGAADSGQLVREMLRSYVNVTAAGGPAPSAAGRGPRRAGEDSIDLVALLGAEWVQEAMRGVVGTVLRQEINDHGETTFSLLGFGNFSLFVSGDRSVISLAQADNVVARTEARDVRTQADERRPADSAVPLAFSDPERSSALHGHASLFERLLDLLVDLITHPLTLLGLAIAVSYWVIVRSFADRARRKGIRVEKAKSKRRRRRSQSDSPAAQRS